MKQSNPYEEEEKEGEKITLEEDKPRFGQLATEVNSLVNRAASILGDEFSGSELLQLPFIQERVALAKNRFSSMNTKEYMALDPDVIESYVRKLPRQSKETMTSAIIDLFDANRSYKKHRR